MKQSSFDDQKQRDAEREQRQLQEAEKAKLDTEFVMGDARGRRFIAALLEASHVFRSSFAPDALAMAFTEGERNQGLKVLSRITAHTPDLYMLLEKERING